MDTMPFFRAVSENRANEMPVYVSEGRDPMQDLPT